MAQLSELSRRALHGAEQLAAQLRCGRGGIIHLLAALAHEQRSVCSRVLLEAGLDLAALGADLQAGRTQPLPDNSLGELAEQAALIAHDAGSHYVGTDHLLRAIVGQPQGVQLLNRYGAAPSEIERRLEGLIRPSLSSGS
jgi:ATP-dependent Clp protease ATP-binding subunit ClpA